MRLHGLDIFRGLALVLMVIFHFSFDLNNFHIVELDLKHGEFWRYFRFVIVTMFVFTAGISLYLTHKNGISFTKVKRRVFLLGFASLLVSIGSYIEFPDSWIYFGILHFFLFASIVGLLFLKIPKISFILGLFIILAHNVHFINMHWLFVLVQEPLNLPAHYTEDLATIFPWFGVFLLGISFAHYKLHEKIFTNSLFSKKGFTFNFLSFAGRHSLFIYLIHQPILFGFFLYILK